MALELELGCLLLLLCTPRLSGPTVRIRLAVRVTRGIFKLLCLPKTHLCYLWVALLFTSTPQDSNIFICPHKPKGKKSQTSETLLSRSPFILLFVEQPKCMSILGELCSLSASRAQTPEGKRNLLFNLPFG